MRKKNTNKKRNHLFIILSIAVVAAIIWNLVLSTKISEYRSEVTKVLKNTESENNSEWAKVSTGEICPSSEGGVNDAPVQMKYFYTDYCPWCMKEEKILKDILKTKGDLIHVEWFNIDECSLTSEIYEVSGVPTFVFSRFGNRTEYQHSGFVYKKDIERLICDITGKCQ